MDTKWYDHQSSKDYKDTSECVLWRNGNMFLVMLTHLNLYT